jgi:hypothetical protein
MRQSPSLLITDVRALAHVLQTTDVYEKPAALRRMLTPL